MRLSGKVRGGLVGLVAACVAGLVWGVGSVGAQTPSVTLSFTDTSNTALTAVGEDDGAVTVRVVATVASAPSSAVSVSVTVGASGSTATSGATNDYTVSASTATVTIASGSTSGYAAVTVTPNADTVTEDHETIKFTGSASGYTVTEADLAITDADRTITLALSDLDFQEPSGVSGSSIICTRTLTATLSGATSTYSNTLRSHLRWSVGQTGNTFTDDNGETVSGAGIAISWTHEPVDASPQVSRYMNIAAGSVTSTVVGTPSIPNCQVSNYQQSQYGTLLFYPNADRRASPTRKFYIRLQSIPSGFTVVNAVGRVIDSDSNVDLTPVPNVLSEGTSGSSVSVAAAFGGRSGEPAPTAGYFSSDQTFTMAVSGGTASAADFTYSPSTPNTVTIPAWGTTSGTGRASLAGLSITDDDVVEGPETLLLTGGLTGFPSYRGSLTITDDDTNIALSLSTSAITEQAGAQSVTVTAAFDGTSSVLTSATDVTVTIAGGTATLGSPGDFTTDATGNMLTVSIAAGAVSGSGSFNITAPDDSTAETAETVALTGSAMVAGAAVPVSGAQMTISDNNAITLSLTDTNDAALTTVGEAAGAQTVRVVATAPSAVGSATDVTVTVGAAGSTASGSDYSVSASSVTVTIASGATSGMADVTLTPVSDSVVEGSESVRFSAPAVGGATVSPVDLAISDDDSDISLAVSPSAVPESATPRAVTVTATFAGSSSVLTSATDVTVTIAGGTAMLGSSGDFTTDATGNMLTVSIPAGATSGSASFNLTARADGTAEGVETVDLSGSATVSGASVAVTAAVLSIADNLIALSLTDTGGMALSAVGEDAAAQTVRVTATAPSAVTADVTVSVTVGASGSTASAGADYSVSASSVSITIANGSASGMADITFTPVSDTVTEDHERVKFTATASGYVLAQVTEAELEITDADRTLTLSWDDPVFPETDMASGNNSVTRDAARVLTATLSGATSTYSSAISAHLTLVRDTAGAGDVTWAHTGAVGTPTAVSVDIAAGAVSGTLTGLTIYIADDRVAEPAETWSLNSTVAGFTVAAAAATIADMDSVITLTARIGGVLATSATMSEGSNGSGVTVHVDFAAPDVNRTTATSSQHASAAAVTLSVVGDTAQAADFTYAPFNPQTVSIAAGQVSSTVSPALWHAISMTGLTIADDDIAEGPETLTVAGESSGFDVAPQTLTIAASDTNIDLSVSPGVLAESADPQPVTVTARFATATSSELDATEITVTAASGMGATGATLGAAGDFTTDATGNTFAVTIPARALTGSASLGVTARADGNAEQPETASITGSALPGGASASVTGVDLAIVDSFAALSVADAGGGEVTALAEAAGEVQLSLTVTVPGWVTVPVGGAEARFRVVGGTARARSGAVFGSGDDFGVVYPGTPDLSNAYPGVVSIAAGNSAATVAFTLDVNDDARYEGTTAETLTVEGFVLVAGIALPAEPVTLRITDNDPPPRVVSTDQGSGPPRPTGCEGRFCDEDDNVHQPAIEAIAALGITQGCDAVDRWRFCPDQHVTRSQMAAFMYRAATRQTPAPDAGGPELADVPGDAWYRAYARWAVANAGFDAPDGQFNPAERVPRSDMAVMLAAAFGLQPDQPAQPQGLFADMAGQPPAVVVAAEALYRVGVTRGCATDPLRYCADKPVTRAQMASFITRALNVDPALTP